MPNGIRSSDISTVPLFFPSLIDVGAQVGAGVDLKAMTATAILLPSGFPAVDLTFDVSDDDFLTWYSLKDTSGPITIPTAQITPLSAFVLDVADFYGWRFIRPRISSAQGSPYTLKFLAVPR